MKPAELVIVPRYRPFILVRTCCGGWAWMHPQGSGLVICEICGDDAWADAATRVVQADPW